MSDKLETDEVNEIKYAAKHILDTCNKNVKINNDSELTAARSELYISDAQSIKSHNDDYSNLLKVYSEFIDETLSTKKKMKKCFFRFSFCVMVLVTIIMITLFIASLSAIISGDFELNDYILPSASSLVSFLTVFIIIPKVIAEYLFNSGEEDIMKDIVKNIQDYDNSIRDKMKDDDK